MTKYNSGEAYEFDDAKSTDTQRRCEVTSGTKVTKSIKVYEWETDKCVDVKLDGEPILDCDVEGEYFRANVVLEPLPSIKGIATVDCRPSFVVYNEAMLRWETP